MAIFVTRTFASGADIGLQLGTEEWLRPLYIGNVWQSIRIGVLLAANPVGSTVLPNGGPLIGVCSGVSAPYGSASTLNFIGVSYAFTGAGTSSYQTGTGGTQPYWAFNTVQAAVTKVGATVNHTAYAGGWNLGIPVQGVGTQRCWGVMVDIIRGSPNYTVGVWDTISNGAGPATSFTNTLSGLLSAMATTGGTIFMDGTQLGTHTATIAASEASGPLDTVNVYSNLSGYPLEIYAVAVQKTS